MQLPEVNPVGIVQVPEGYTRTPRRYGSGFRLAAGLTLGVFVLVGIVSTVWTLAVYCLTSYAGAPITLP